MEAVARVGEHGKLIASWEGPYKVTSQVWPGTYRLQTTDGSPIPEKVLLLSFSFLHVKQLCILHL